MEFNSSAWKMGIVFALIQAFIVILTNMLVMKDPPTVWQFVQLAIIPAGLTFLTTLVQKCFPAGKNPEVKQS